MFLPKLITVLLIVLGESTLILAQVNGARASLAQEQGFWTLLTPTHWYFWATIAGSFLILAGYFYGITVFKNIWLVTIASWAGIILAEPIISVAVFQNAPQGRVLAGFLLALLGFTIANL